MKNKSIDSLASNIVAHWRNMNEEPRAGELILIELVCSNDTPVIWPNKDNNFITFIPENQQINPKNFSIGYVENPNKKTKNKIKYSIFKNEKMFIVKDGGIYPSNYEKNKFPFNALTVKKWIYINELLYL